MLLTHLTSSHHVGIYPLPPPQERVSIIQDILREIYSYNLLYFYDFNCPILLLLIAYYTYQLNCHRCACMGKTWSVWVQYYLSVVSGIHWGFETYTPWIKGDYCMSRLVHVTLNVGTPLVILPVPFQV
jgi:hypothetical protein